MVLLALLSTVTVFVNGGNADLFVGSNCKTLDFIVGWDLGSGRPVTGDKVLVMGVRSASTCSSTSTLTAPDRLFETDSPTTQKGTATSTITASAMVLTASDAGVNPCDAPEVAGRTSANPWTTVLCVQYQTPNLSGTTIDTGTLNVNFAPAPPKPPSNVSISPGDGHLRVFWSKGDDAENIATYDVHVVPEGETPDGGPIQSKITSTNTDVDHTDDGTALQNDAGYAVTIVAHDVYANVSSPSAEVVGVPIPVADFYDHYKDEGGSALGGRGCATGSAGAWIAGLGIALALLFARRRKTRGGAALLALFAVLAPAVEAASSDRRSRWLLVAIKMDRYSPQVDSEAGLAGRTPYFDVFGPRAPPRYQIEVDWEVAHPFGSLLLGVTGGFWQNVGKGVLPGVRDANGRAVQTQDTALLDVVPFGAIATYRFDWLADRWARFPLIPYAQAGLMRALWASYNGRGDISKHPASGGRGSGWTYGYTTAVGVAIALDAIDPAVAREAYVDLGIQRTSFFAEYGWTRLDNFGKGSGALVLSDRAWRFGLSVEF